MNNNCCDKCIHENLCEKRSLMMTDFVEDCCDFKNKNLFIKLPCGINDKVYIVDKNYKRIEVSFITGIEYQGDNIFFISLSNSNLAYFNYMELIDNKNRKVYFTEQDALHALKGF